MSFTTKWDGSNIVVKFKGKVSFREIDEADSLIYGDKRFDQMQYQIFDFADIDEFILSEHEMKVIGSLDKASSNWNNNVKVAVVTTSEEFKELMKKYMEVMQDTNWQTRIFATFIEALDWCKE